MKISLLKQFEFNYFDFTKNWYNLHTRLDRDTNLWIQLTVSPKNNNTSILKTWVLSYEGREDKNGTRIGVTRKVANGISLQKERLTENVNEMLEELKKKINDIHAHVQ